MRATLETLPTELKTRIAKLCSEADTSWRDCKEAIKSRQDTDYRVLATIERESTYHGQSLKTLSRVSKNWREISVPMLFQVSSILFYHFRRYSGYRSGRLDDRAGQVHACHLPLRLIPSLRFFFRLSPIPRPASEPADVDGHGRCTSSATSHCQPHLRLTTSRVNLPSRPIPA